MGQNVNDLEKQRLDEQAKQREASELSQRRTIRQQALSYASNNKKEGEDVLETAKKFASFLNGE
jgi:hypothetical protein